jgi:ribonuclease P protein component
MIREGSEFREASWEEALRSAGDGLRRVRREHGKHALAVYQGNPTAHNLGLMTVGQVAFRTLGTRNLYIVVACPNGLETTRLGLSVGKTIWKSAVKRNRIRRVFREAFRLAYPELPPGLDVVLIPARPKLVPVLADIRAELVGLVLKAASKRAGSGDRKAREEPRRPDRPPGREVP